jgi:type I restriction enzyme S subunit
VLINIVGPPLGKVAIVPPSYPEWNMNQAVVAFRPLPSLDRQLLVWLLLSRPVIGRLVATSKATAGQFNIALNACRALPLPIPPLEEQRRLVEALHQEFTALRRMQGTVAVQLERASQLRRAILSAAFTGRLVNTLGSVQTGATPWSGIIPTPIGVGQ